MAFTLVGLLLLLMVNGLQLSNRVWEAAERSRSDAEQVRRAQALLRDLLERAAIRGTGGAGTAEDTASFLGTSDSIRFIGPPPARRAGPARHRLTLELVGEGPAGQVVLSWLPLPWDSPPRQEPGPSDRRVLLDQISGLEISYLAESRTRDERHWLSRWDDPARLPLLIQIALTTKEGERRHWPRLLIAPKLTASGG